MSDKLTNGVLREDFLNSTRLEVSSDWSTKRTIKEQRGEAITGSIHSCGFSQTSVKGPDFPGMSAIEIDGLLSKRHPEIHRLASDWKQQCHARWSAYNSVVLSMLFGNDQVVYRNDGTPILLIELKGKIFLDHLEKIIEPKCWLINTDLPCAQWVKRCPREFVRFLPGKSLGEGDCRKKSV